MAVNDLITFRKGIASQWISVNPVLASGEPGYDLTNSILKIGDGVSNWVSLSGIGSTSVGGSSSSSVGVRGIISTTGTLSTFSVSGGYSAGYLDLFQNGVKLLSGSDFTATNGTSVTLSNSVPSGTVLEYISLGTSVSSSNYTKLDSISSSFNGSSTSFGLAVSGTPYYPVSANTLGIYVGGVAQEPISSYSVSGSNIVFTEAPASGLTFWGVGYGTTAVATLNGIVPGSASSPAISSSNDLNTGFYFPSSGNISVAGNLGIGTSSPSTLLDINNNKFRVRNSKTPSSPSDNGNQGDICWDSNYIYVCTNTNSWTRTPISAWSSDPYFSNVVLLLHMDGSGSSFVDSSATTKTITAFGSATQSTSQSKWGGKSAYFSGTGDYLQLSDSDAVELGGVDWVLEMWVRTTSSTQYATLISRTPASFSTGMWSLMLNLSSSTSGDIAMYVNEVSPSVPTLLSSGVSVRDGEWHHIAVSRSGSEWSMYVDGARVATATSNATIVNIAGGIRIGADQNYGRYYDGFIDDLRITVGSARAYTGSTITVPTAAFPDYNT